MSVANRERSKTALVGLVLFCISVFLSSYSSRNPSVGRIGAYMIQEVVFPVQYVGNVAVDSVSYLINRYLFLYGAQATRDSLEERVKHLELKNAELTEALSENKRLKKILKLSTTFDLTGEVGNVIGFDPSRWVKAIYVDRGAKHGIQVGQAVVSGAAVVGQVVAVGPSTARVLLLTDHASSIDVLIQESRIRGTAEGDGTDLLQLNFVLKELKVSAGQTVLASGRDGIFPRGVVVGRLVDVSTTNDGMFQRIAVRPAAEIDQLDTVLIVNNPSLAEFKIVQQSEEN